MIPATGIARSTPQNPAIRDPSRRARNTKMGWMPIALDMMRGPITLRTTCCNAIVRTSTQMNASGAPRSVTASTGISAMIGPKNGMIIVRPEKTESTPAKGTPNGTRMSSEPIPYISPRRSDPRMKPPKERSALSRRRSASLCNSGDSAMTNRFQSWSPSMSMMNAMIRTSVALKSTVAVADTMLSASVAIDPAKAESRAGTCPYRSVTLTGTPRRSRFCWSATTSRAARSPYSGARVTRSLSWATNSCEIPRA